MQKTKRFLQAIFKGLNGYVEIRTINTNGEVKRYFYPTTQIDKLVSHLTNDDSFQDTNVYFGICPRQERKGKEENVKQVNCFWADLDCKDEKERQERLEKLKSFESPPSIIVNSGHGYHAYWLLTKPHFIQSNQDRLNMKGYVKGLSIVLNADKTFDLSRILRVPGTKNIKDPDNPLPVEILEFNPTLKYEFSAFEQFKTEETFRAGITEDELSKLLKGVVAGERHIAATRIAGHYIGKEDSPATVLELLRGWNVRNKPPLQMDELRQIVEDFAANKKRGKRPVYQQNGVYLKRGQKGISRITNFTIFPKVRVQVDGLEYLKASITTEGGKKYPNIQFNPDSWISRYNFKKALGGLLDVEYKGSEDDIQDIKGILASQNPPIKQGVKTTGLHQIDGKWLYVEEKLSWDKDGPRQDVTYLSENPYRIILLKQNPLSSPQLDRLLECLFNFNSEDVIYPLLGFCFACFIKERTLPLTHQNPILVCWGEKDSGKTATLNLVIRRLFGIEAPLENIGHPTEFGFARIISSSNLAPILFDEHKAGKISQVQKDRISEMLRSVYNQTRLTRGTPSLGIVEFIYSAPVVVSGEMGITELSIKDRIIEAYFSKKKIENKKDIFGRLIKCNLGSLGRDFLLWTLRLEDKQLRETWEQQLEAVDKELEDRLRENTAHARLGLALFSQYLESREKQPIHKDILAIIDETQKKNILEESNKSIVDSIIEAFSLMVEQEILKEGKHYRVDSDLRLGLYVSGIYPLFRKWVYDTKWDGEILDKTSFLKQLKETRYFVESTNIRFGQKVRSGVYLDSLKMEHLEIEALIE